MASIPPSTSSIVTFPHQGILPQTLDKTNNVSQIISRSFPPSKDTEITRYMIELVLKSASITACNPIDEMGNNNTYELLIENELNGVHSIYPGNVVLKNKIILELIPENEKNTIHFSNGGVLHRCSLMGLITFDVVLKSFTVLGDSVEVVCEKFGISKVIVFTTPRVLEFWKNITWK